MRSYTLKLINAHMYFSAVREDRMPGGRHRHKSQTQDMKEKTKKRRPSKESSTSTGSSSSDSPKLSPTSPIEDIDYMGIISELIM